MPWTRPTPSAQPRRPSGGDNDPPYTPADPTRAYPGSGRAGPQPRRELFDRPADLDPEHQLKLEGSGLKADTIRAAGAYTERDTGRLRRRLRGPPAVAPALVLPGFDRHGRRTGYDVARLSVPRRQANGKVAKYLMPSALASRAYFPPLGDVCRLVNTPQAPVLITEGILKALAAAQAGVPCIGLMGVWNWQ